MRIVLINPPHTAIGSRIPRENLPPLGLLSIGGPLIDDGHRVTLIDADLRWLATATIVAETELLAPEIIMIGHSGSSSAHNTVVEICQAIKTHLPEATIVYGGVHPTYHWHEILTATSAIDIIVKGEGEATSLRLLHALEAGEPLTQVRGIAFRSEGDVIATERAAVITQLDDYRVGWELINHADYSYWGGKRAVVVQFSRGCPYPCSYCGQRSFWTQWRHRDPKKLAKELARLHREQGVELINFADELPTGSRKAWQEFLQALIAEDVPLLLVGSTRAGDIVRDEDILHLYKKAGVIRFLLGIEAYSEVVITDIKKHGNIAEDRKAIQLLRKHGIISMATYVVGFFEEKDSDYWQTFQHLRAYDPDQVQLLYATPHRWTPFYNAVEDRRVVQTDTSKWDYKHQVLEAKRVPTWRVFLWFKSIEALIQSRPKVILRMLLHKDADYRHAMRWYTKIGKRVWLHEVFEFVFRLSLNKQGPSLREFSGSSFVYEEYALQRKKLRRTKKPVNIIPSATVE